MKKVVCRQRKCSSVLPAWWARGAGIGFAALFIVAEIHALGLGLGRCVDERCPRHCYRLLLGRNRPCHRRLLRLWGYKQR